jgi:hypothetical protein
LKKEKRKVEMELSLENWNQSKYVDQIYELVLSKEEVNYGSVESKSEEEY